MHLWREVVLFCDNRRKYDYCFWRYTSIIQEEACLGGCNGYFGALWKAMLYFNTQATKSANTKFDKEVILRRIELDSYSLQKSILHVTKFLHEYYSRFLWFGTPIRCVFPTYKESSFSYYGWDRQLGCQIKWSLSETATVLTSAFLSFIELQRS